MDAADLAWAAERGHVTLLDEYRVTSVAAGDAFTQHVRVCSPTAFIALETIGQALVCGGADPFFASWRDEVTRRGGAAAAPYSPGDEG